MPLPSGFIRRERESNRQAEEKLEQAERRSLEYARRLTRIEVDIETAFRRRRRA